MGRMRDRVYGWRRDTLDADPGPVGEGASEPSNAVSVRNVMPADRPDGGDSQKLQKCPVSRLAIAVRALGKTVRLRGNRKFVSRQACLVCGRTPSDPHHLCNLAHSDTESAISSRSRFVGSTTASFIAWMTRPRGGVSSPSILTGRAQGVAAHAGQWHGHLDQWRHRAWVCSRNASVPARPRRHDPTHRCGELRLQNCRRLHKPMTSFRQIEVNRNALSTGPKTDAGKRRSRRSSTPSDYRNRRCRSGRHRRLSSIRSGYHRSGATWSASGCSGLHRCCGACVVPPQR